MYRSLAVPAVVLLAVSGCSADRHGEPAEPSAQAAPAPERPAGGTPDRPTQLDPSEDLLAWDPVPGSVEDAVTSSGTWVLTVEASGTTYRLDGPTQSFGSGSNDGTRITSALLDRDWAVVVHQDQAEKRPASAEVTDLAAGEQFTIDRDSDVPTTAGGTWALGGDTLVHATVTPEGAYCLASVDLASRTSAVTWCAQPQQGFNAAHVMPDATTVLSFDDAKPSCRTVGNVDSGQLDPFPGVPACAAWEGAQLGADDAIWSVIPKESRIEAAELFARVGEDYYALGPGTSGTLVPCAGAAYFVRDPQVEGDTAQLLRWDGSSLAVIYEAPPGQSFLEAPRCGDAAMVVTALSEGGDEQVVAALPYVG